MVSFNDKIFFTNKNPVFFVALEKILYFETKHDLKSVSHVSWFLGNFYFKITIIIMLYYLSVSKMLS